MLFVVTLAESRIATAQGAAAISQGFKTNETNLATGALVSFESGSQAVVQLANNARANQLLGVVGDKPLVEIKGNDQEIKVIVSGSAPVLVSDINGVIKSGDRIATSPIDGVGMKATTSSQVIGTAETDFSNISTVEKTIADRSGKQQKIHTGLLSASINVTYYSPDEKKTFIPVFLQQLTSSIAGGRTVSPVRILIATTALLMGFMSIGVLLYSSVRSSIISIGRNPLSERAVNKSLIEVGITSIGILLAMLIAIYLVLTI
ncbi:MAG TPA: hypothetical protein VNX65_00335 [Patescibacteria group bacterium]|nr:hypothetical protein [Patescibacteria group bacterium]